MPLIGPGGREEGREEGEGGGVRKGMGVGGLPFQQRVLDMVGEHDQLAVLVLNRVCELVRVKGPALLYEWLGPGGGKRRKGVRRGKWNGILSQTSVALHAAPERWGERWRT